MPANRPEKWPGLDASAQARARIRFTGKTLSGQPLWTTNEDLILKQAYPDYAKAGKLLRHRTAEAIRTRAIRLKIAKRIPPWTAKEVSDLRRRWRDATRSQLMAEFPRHSWNGIAQKARRLGFRRRWQPKQTGRCLLDEIRSRASDLRISLSDLDRICSARDFFKKSSQGHFPSRNILLRAIAALGGRVEIVWR